MGRFGLAQNKARAWFLCVLWFSWNGAQTIHAAAEKPPAEHGGAGAGQNEPSPTPPVSSDKYVHEWPSLPQSTIPRLVRGHSLEIKPARGYVTLVFFLSSWCDSCQDLIQKFHSIERRFQKWNVRTFYVMAHDTRDDASGFYQEHGLEAPAGLANHEILRQYNNPPLPTIYLADKNNSLVTRYENLTAENLDDLARYLSQLVSF